jgi:hypothetical protein
MSSCAAAATWNRHWWILVEIHRQAPMTDFDPPKPGLDVRCEPPQAVIRPALQSSFVCLYDRVRVIFDQLFQ